MFKRAYIRIVSYYLLFGFAWILLSDAVVESVASPAFAMRLQSVKGILFVSASAALLYVLGRRTYLERERREKEKIGVYQQTVRGAYHILGNYLNQMQIMMLAADDCPDFDPSAKAMAKEATNDAQRALANLRDLADVNEKSIERAVRTPTRPPFPKG
jgi:hypothetical protein